MDTVELLEKRLLDARFKLRGTRPIDRTPIQIVAVDDQSFELLDEKWPIKGSLYARLIRNLKRAGARLIVFDIEFTESNALFPSEDSLFADAVREAGNVILAGKMAYSFDHYLEQPYAVPVTPLPELLEAAASWGIINDIPDADDFTRRYLLYLPHGDCWKGSLGLEVMAAMHKTPEPPQLKIEDQVCHYGSLKIPLIDRQSLLINYYGPAGTFPAISFASVLDDSSFDLGPAHDSNYMEFFTSKDNKLHSPVAFNPFADRVVLVGVTASELGDMKNTPFYDYYMTPRKMSGVEIHAHALQTMLDGSFIKRVSVLQVFLGCLLFAYLIFVIVTQVKPVPGLVLTSFTVIAAFMATYVLFAGYNLWFDFVPLFLASIMAFVPASIGRYSLERAEQARRTEMFSRFVPEEVIKELVSKPQLLRLGGERRYLTILFADLQGFSAIAENTAPEMLVEMLNEYLTVMTDIILDHGGIIDKYEGDLIMAEFGIPVPHEDHALMTCRAALEMQSAFQGLYEKWRSLDKPAPQLRIGINTGEVIVGNMGSNEVFDYTVLGDTVNLCSRIEEANKIYGTTILISQATRQKLPSGFITRELGDLHVRGRNGTVLVYELISESARDLSDERKNMLGWYQLGLSRVQQEDWEEAIHYLERALDHDPDDQPSRILLDRCQQHMVLPASEILASTDT